MPQITVWKTAEGKISPMRDLPLSHLSNIYWFSLTGGSPETANMAKELIDELHDCNTMPYEPVYYWEIKHLKERGLLRGKDIIFQGKVIGKINKIIG